MKITDVRLTKVEGQFPRALSTSVERQVGALDLFPEYRARAYRAPKPEELGGTRPISGVYVHVDTDEGITGLFGPIMEAQGFLIATGLRPHLLGQDPIAVEHLWDVMARHDRHARKGYMMMAISAVDLALWDIRGKAAGLPVYRLLGGPTRAAVPAYASMLGHSLEPDKVAETAREFVRKGYTAQKWFFRYGPGDGREAIARNMELVRTLREAVGDGIDLMFDAWLGWDVPFSIEMGRRMAPYNPRWLEEPVQPDHIESYAEIRRATGIPIAGGEHEYTRWGFKTLLDAEAIDVIQADPDWTGGLTEMPKICALASAYDKQVVPHGHSVVPALHLIAAQSPAVCPMLEYLVLANEMKQWFHTTTYKPENGLVRLPTDPGLG
ncbi:MAG: hypothetical protein GXY76_09865, partial [Chloroflexi bacterium]|nr:hypothetical protein [Chloroflexota bacterium]